MKIQSAVLSIILSIALVNALPIAPEAQSMGRKLPRMNIEEEAQSMGRKLPRMNIEEEAQTM
ncbi:hypothetical protein BGZ76_008833, partial [Entomortierella beljakovae]